MTTVADLINEIDRDFLIHYARPQYDTIATSVDSSLTAIKLTTTQTLSRGALLDVGLELMYVASWNQAIQTATVIRGFLGSTPVNHDNGALVRINPRFSTRAMFDSIKNELSSWDERVYRVEQGQVTFSAYYPQAEATPSVEPYQILYMYARPESVTAYDRKWVAGRLRRGEDASQFASGFSVEVDSAFGRATVVDVMYAIPFPEVSTLTATTNLSTDWDMSEGLEEVVKWGTLARLVSGKEAVRADAQSLGRPDLAQSFPALAAAKSGDEFMNMRNRAYDREARRLLARHGIAR